MPDIGAAPYKVNDVVLIGEETIAGFKRPFLEHGSNGLDHTDEDKGQTDSQHPQEYLIGPEFCGNALLGQAAAADICPSLFKFSAERDDHRNQHNQTEIGSDRHAAGFDKAEHEENLHHCVDQQGGSTIVAHLLVPANGCVSHILTRVVFTN